MDIEEDSTTQKLSRRFQPNSTGGVSYVVLGIRAMDNSVLKVVVYAADLVILVALMMFSSVITETM